MIRSMTGFGESDGPTGIGRVRVELRSVNHRYLNVTSRLPTSLARFEAEIREWLRGEVVRGHVNCSVRLEARAGDGTFPGYRIDEERVAAYLSAFRDLAHRFQLPGQIDLALLARYNDIIVRRDEEELEAAVSPEELRPVVEEAARRMTQMREQEGERLHADLEDRLAAIDAALDRVAEHAPERLVAERERLIAAVRELTAGAAVDHGRIAQEIAILAERWDVNEELVRFRSHISLFREMLAAPGEEAVGKRLAFLVQEMHREANTVGSKANSARIAHQVIAMKEEVERLREQVENVE